MFDGDQHLLLSLLTAQRSYCAWRTFTGQWVLSIGPQVHVADPLTSVRMTSGQEIDYDRLLQLDHPS